MRKVRLDYIPEGKRTMKIPLVKDISEKDAEPVGSVDMPEDMARILAALGGNGSGFCVRGRLERVDGEWNVTAMSIHPAPVMCHKKGTEMKVRIKPITRYAVETLDGTPVGDFEQSEVWQDMSKLVAPTGAVLIVESIPRLSMVFSELSIPCESTVYKASPELLTAIAECEKREELRRAEQLPARAVGI